MRKIFTHKRIIIFINLCVSESLQTKKNQMKKLIYSLFLVLISVATIAQNELKRIDPPNWWVGMNNQNLQLMIYGENISAYNVQTDYPHVRIVSIEKVENPNYLFLNLLIEPNAKSGQMLLKFLKNGDVLFSQKYELKDRRNEAVEKSSFSSEDAVYLIMSDRFANGDYTNDTNAKMLDQSGREAPFGRHGGDIRGIIDHLDYIKNMGFTAIWLTPVRENNMQESSYHGYAITDFYKIDPRHGSNELYKELSEKCKEKGLKLIFDVVTNHCGTNYFWRDDLPSKDWYNGGTDYKGCSFQPGIWSDPHASKIDIYENEAGWFARPMPDLNQHNNFLSTYLIQNTIWWVEYADIDGLRSDTHSYNNREFVAKWAKAINAEYPSMNIVGEVWLKKPSTLSYWQKDAVNKTGFNSNLPMVMDFPLHFAMQKAFHESIGEEKGMARLHAIVAQDFLYANPDNLMLVIDSHDVSRIYNLMNKNIADYKMAIALMATMRGMPQIFAGSEILSEGTKAEGDGLMRKDFPGGWKDDTVNGFTGEGLTEIQQDAQDYVKTLFNWRQTNEAVTRGKLVHFVPKDEVYVYFRYTEKSRVMVLLNNNIEDKEINTSKYNEMLVGFNAAKNVITGEKIKHINHLSIKGKTATILELE